MKTLKVLAIVLLIAPQLFAAERATKKSTTVEETTTTKSETSNGADNTRVNERDRSELARTADQQSNKKSDIDITARIRRDIVGNKRLSTNAHNIKIITVDGTVTLKGPVEDVQEKRTVEQIASSIAGPQHVASAIEALKN